MHDADSNHFVFCRHLIIFEDVAAPSEEGTTPEFSNTGFACSNPSRDAAFLVTILLPCVISVFRREVDENCVLLGCYAASSSSSSSSSNFLPTFRYNLSVPSPRCQGLKNVKKNMGPASCLKRR
jgi:hypothetical protein